MYYVVLTQQNEIAAAYQGSNWGLDSAVFPYCSQSEVGNDFRLNPLCRVEQIVFDDEIPFGDEICLDGGWVDFICVADLFLARARILFKKCPAWT